MVRHQQALHQWNSSALRNGVWLPENDETKDRNTQKCHFRPNSFEINVTETCEHGIGSLAAFSTSTLERVGIVNWEKPRNQTSNLSSSKYWTPQIKWTETFSFIHRESVVMIAAVRLLKPLCSFRGRGVTRPPELDLATVGRRRWSF